MSDPSRVPSTTSSSAPVRPRPRHLMDPAHPQRDQSNSPGITRVQKWVMSALLVTTLVHLIGGLLVAAWFIDPSQTQSRVGLAALCAVLGLLTVVAARLVHGKPPVSAGAVPWFALSLVPAVVGVVYFATA